MKLEKYQSFDFVLMHMVHCLFYYERKLAFRFNNPVDMNINLNALYTKIKCHFEHRKINFCKLYDSHLIVLASSHLNMKETYCLTAAYVSD